MFEHYGEFKRCSEHPSEEAIFICKNDECLFHGQVLYCAKCSSENRHNHSVVFLVAECQAVAQSLDQFRDKFRQLAA